jgi:two-component system, cell cycle sensor histidine kinase and response regulator CckA
MMADAADRKRPEKKLDITERKRAEEALREKEAHLRALSDDLRRSEERYRLLFERSFVGIFRTRADGILVECNHAFARILGYRSAAEARGHNVLEHYATSSGRDTIVAKISVGEDVIDAEVVGQRCGSLVPVAMSVRRVVDHDGAVHEGVLVDLTDRKRGEEAKALRSVAELANAAAHEINNPLTVIIGELDLTNAADDITARIARMKAAAERIRDIVKRMVQITRLESSTEWPGDLPPMLDLRRSGPAPKDAP